MSDHTMERWKHLAIALGDDIYQAVNTKEYVGTEDETGYLLMFFNKKNHNGKATMVSSHTDRSGLKKLLKEALRNLDRATIVCARARRRRSWRSSNVCSAYSYGNRVSQSQYARTRRFGSRYGIVWAGGPVGIIFVMLQ
jgi:hypothetical protein